MKYRWLFVLLYNDEVIGTNDAEVCKELLETHEGQAVLIDLASFKHTDRLDEADEEYAWTEVTSNGAH
jgi:hypothetical protein